MAKVTRIPLGGKPGEGKIELPEQVQVSLHEMAGSVKQGLLAFAVAVGLEVFKTLLQEDINAVVGEKGKHDSERSAYRHTTKRSSVVLGGRKVGINKPRVRSVAGEEMALPVWAAFSGDELLSEMALERMLAGLSTRRYPAGLEPVGDDLDQRELPILTAALQRQPRRCHRKVVMLRSHVVGSSPKFKTNGDRDFLVLCPDSSCEEAPPLSDHTSAKPHALLLFWVLRRICA